MQKLIFFKPESTSESNILCHLIFTASNTVNTDLTCTNDKAENTQFVSQNVLCP